MSFCLTIQIISFDSLSLLRSVTYCDFLMLLFLFFSYLFFVSFFNVFSFQFYSGAGVLYTRVHIRFRALQKEVEVYC